MEIFIPIVGALSAILVAVIGAILTKKNSVTLQIRKMKERHYIEYIKSLHNLAANNSNEAVKEYTFARDKLFIIASENVIRQILIYEEKAVGKPCNEHDAYLTSIIKEIRIDLKLKDKNFPQIYLKKA